MTKRRLIGVLCILALVIGMVPSLAGADPIVTDLVIHKRQVATGTVLEQHNGLEITDFTGTNLAGSTPIAGVIFKYWTISPTVTPAQMAVIQGLANIAAIEAYATANPTILTGGTLTSATGVDGTVRINGMAEGMYIFAETNAADLNITEFIGVPFLLELPAMKVDGTAYFGTGANALHVYPKNVLKIPGLDVETKTGLTKATSLRIGGTAFDIYKKNAAGDYVKIDTASLPSGIATLADLPAGEYQLINTTVPTGYLIDNRPIYFTVSAGVVSYSATGNNPESWFTAATATENAIVHLLLRASPVPDKEVDGAKEKTYEIGDVIPWTVKLPVPADIDQYLTFKMVDTLDTKLSWAGTDGIGDVSVKVDGVEIPATCYTKAVTATTLTLTFDPDLITAYAGKNIFVSYKTIINDTAVMGEDIANDAALEFNNGHGGSGTNRPPDPPKVWTGGFKWVKVDGANPTITLEGAEFKIATNAAGTTFVKWTTELIAANTASMFATPMTVGSDIVMKSNATGQFEIKGLAGGTYYLVETKAPTRAGTTYNLMRDPAAFVVTKTSYVAATPGINVENRAGLRIPQTGGIGMALFTVVGLSMMGYAVFLFRKKKDTGEVAGD